MISFSVKDSLIKLKEKNYSADINQTIDSISTRFDGEEIKILAQRGILLDSKIIRLYFLNNVGFRCMNEQAQIYGKLPICRNIESFLNNIYIKEVNSLVDSIL